MNDQVYTEMFFSILYFLQSSNSEGEKKEEKKTNKHTNFFCQLILILVWTKTMLNLFYEHNIQQPKHFFFLSNKDIQCQVSYNFSQVHKTSKHFLEAYTMHVLHSLEK